MKVGLIDVDGHNFPNIPLMKLSAWHKAKGDSVEWYSPLLSGHCDRVYMSKVFSFTPDYPWPVDADEIVKGGSGYCIKRTPDGREYYDKAMEQNLPDEIEHIYPDYEIYPELTKDTAYGFLTRGCPRGCDFCHVATKEGKRSCQVAELNEFWRGQKNIVLCDPNILACKDHLRLFEQLAESKAVVDFNQGLDIRLITEKNIAAIKRVRIKMIHFAFDRWEDKDVIEPKLRWLREQVDYDHHKIMVYILVNNGTTIEQDLYRIQLCRELDMQPYPMIYDKTNAPAIYHRMQRWCNPIIFWTVPDFGDYTRGATA